MLDAFTQDMLNRLSVSKGLAPRPEPLLKGILLRHASLQSQGGMFQEYVPYDERLQKLQEYQAEMQAFVEFLKTLICNESA